ncbi:capsule assembly Wzi family protein [Falsirhodobacter algicola]|uniref:Aldo/keto reductase n=1 Tax=Falsirhodobacter algicola TaxID=2692330 RepID=A0A8J8MSS6_9RHOB|nr:capsule assembly Wzi family protein [Falsirhodobacter algicola]QUS36060.1 aldo/keto reductase [Falsirhodobacter algicola]
MTQLRSLFLAAASFGTILSAQGAFAQGFTVTGSYGSRDLLGGFPSDGSSDEAEVQLSYAGQGPRLGYNLAVTVGDDDDSVDFDDSFVEAYAGGFAFGLGAVDRNWSPSRFSSLILSDNADPIPSAYVVKRQYTAFDTPWLSWIGPWKGEFFVGQTDSDGNPDNTKLMGMRLQLQPVDGFEIDLVRTAQWGGDGRSESLKTFLDVLTGDTNEGEASEANQLAGIGLSWTLPEEIAPLRLYAQAVGEDESGGLPSCFMYLAGVEGVGTAFGLPTTVTLEGATTEISDSENGFCGPGTAYNNNAYPGGYTHHEDVMGMPMDTDSRMAQLIIEHQLARFALDWSVGYYEINTTNRPDHRLSSTEVDGTILRVGASQSWGDTTLRGGVAWQSFDLDNDDIDAGMGVSFSVSRTF